MMVTASFSATTLPPRSGRSACTRVEHDVAHPEGLREAATLGPPRRTVAALRASGTRFEKPTCQSSNAAIVGRCTR